ncbi:hypothetical protein L202_06332 [Cryptococcus amylolentus CBS 6039]|uniref:Mitochondrial carrier n=1 Tax=Cryptococcus amylolentus CBS 6039 TaxID=1295533 RepID=A0A1E3HFK8_9TREE|nr:hypothetical protein L202_06332 [Cryptococcus amylolentus CBS 6039]ODN75122.1 hypothetical protein L202_06332 [Cryptococcus amylolentus CBS 6039]
MSSNGRPSSVRGLYTPPAEEWVFLPPTVSPPNPSSTSPPAHLPTPFHDASTSSSSLLDAANDADLVIPAMGRPFNLFLSEYLATAMGMPFEVGKTLLQVEYRPRRQFEALEGAGEGVKISEEETVTELQDEDELSNPDEADMYFTDRLNKSADPLVSNEEPVALQADASGYLPDLHPTWLLKDDPDISRGNGVWGMIRRIRYTPSEGLPALWKSQLVSTLHAFLTTTVQPTVHSCLLLLTPYPALALDTPLAALPNPALPLGLQIASHLLTHLVLSPLEIIRTRLIVMPASHPSTPSSVKIFRDMVSDEGGFTSMIFHPNLLLPAVLEHTLRPLFALSTPLILERYLGISPDLSPITYSLLDLSLGLTHLLVLLPIETVRRRLQLQHRGKGGKRMKTVVRVRERDYVGIVEGLWRIASEETSVRRTKLDKGEEGGWFAGVRQLYRGFGMAATAHATVFSLGLVSATLSGGDGGWKEI